MHVTTQHDCGDDNVTVLWKTHRQVCITSSNMGKIAKRLASTPVGHLVHQLLYPTFQGNKTTAWGLSQEDSVGFIVARHYSVDYFITCCNNIRFVTVTILLR